MPSSDEEESPERGERGWGAQPLGAGDDVGGEKEAVKERSSRKRRAPKDRLRSGWCVSSQPLSSPALHVKSLVVFLSPCRLSMPQQVNRRHSLPLQGFCFV